MFAARTTLPGHFSESETLDIAQALSASLEEHGVSISLHRQRDGGEWFLQCLSAMRIPEKDFVAAQPGAWNIEEIADDQDWLAQSYRQFPAFSVGPFFIYGSHHEGAIPEGSTGLQIDAATAFGSGEHGTTKGCLLAMLDLKEAGICPWNVLDMGTGSGILAIAAWKLWKTPVLAVDNDREAVRVAEHHRALNHVPAGDADMICAAGDGFRTAAVQQKKPFELIIANILAVTLKEMADEVKAVCDVNGYLILSGILQKQAQEVLDVYALRGFAPAGRFDIGEWSTLILHHAAT